MSQNLLSAAVVIGALRVKGCSNNDFKSPMIAFEMNKWIIINLIVRNSLSQKVKLKVFPYLDLMKMVK